MYLIPSPPLPSFSLPPTVPRGSSIPQRVEFAYTVTKFDRRFRMQKRDLLLTSTHVFLIGREKQKAGPNKGEFLEVIKRQLSMSDIAGVAMSTRQDGFVILRVPAECVLASFCGLSVLHLHVLLLCVVVACCVACLIAVRRCCVLCCMSYCCASLLRAVLHAMFCVLFVVCVWFVCHTCSLKKGMRSLRHACIGCGVRFYAVALSTLRPLPRRSSSAVTMVHITNLIPRAHLLCVSLRIHSDSAP